ncbi:AAA family ATPase [bacterium]|nr:AAA family ATPase [bacterium]
MQANLDVALAWAEVGIPIFPARAESKRPHVTGWQNKATTDPAQLRRWWRKWPDAMPAIPTGSRSGIAVLDLDRKNGKDGFETLRELGHDPDALSPHVISTPSGGGHIYFRHVDGLRNSTDEIGPGVDVRAYGGLVIAPGAINGKGSYGRLSGPLKRIVADLPEWPAVLQSPAREPRQSSGDVTGLSFEEFRDALMTVPNDDTNPDAAGRDWWVKMLAGVHHETDGSEEGLELAQDWSAQHGSYNHDQTEAVWHSFLRNDGATGATVLWEARKRGWGFNPAELLTDEDVEVAQWTLEAIDAIVFGGEPAAPPFFTDMADMLKDPAPPREWHVPDWIPAKTVHMLAGDGGSGKSLLGIQLAVATGTGADWLGHTVSKPGVALYYGAEDDRDELHRRFADVCRGLDVDPAEHCGRVMLRSAVAEDTVFATVAKDGKVKATPILKRMEREIAAMKPSLVVLDTLANLHALDPNSQEQAKAFISLLVGFCQRYECTVLLLAHPSRTGMATGDGDGFSVGWNNSVRSRSFLAADKDNPEINVLSSKKANYGKRGLTMKMEWHEGCYVKVNNEYADASRAKFVFLDILDRLARQQTFVSNSPGVNYAPSRFAEEPEAESHGFSKEQLSKAMRAMLKDGVLQVEEYQKSDRKPGKRLARGDAQLPPNPSDHLGDGDED